MGLLFVCWHTPLSRFRCNYNEPNPIKPTPISTHKQVDRLVNQSYQNWAPRVQEAAHGQDPGLVVMPQRRDEPEGLTGGGDEDAYALRPTTVRCV